MKSVPTARPEVVPEVSSATGPEVRYLVDDLERARRFYVGALGARPVHASDDRLEVDFFGHALGLHLRSSGEAHESPSGVDAPADGAPVADAPFVDALVLGVDDWCALSERLRARDVAHTIDTPTRISAAPGKQCVIRLEDPAGNAVEVWGFARSEHVLAA